MLVCRRLGILSFSEADRIQRDYAEKRQKNEIPDHILFLEHFPVYTCGKQCAEGDFLKDRAWIDAQGIQVIATDRGGRLTYHGPGQLVGYLIVKLRAQSVPNLVHGIETALIDTLAAWNIHGLRDEHPGVWVKEGDSMAKIAAIGLHLSHGITRHGFALNVNPTLDHYSGIIPCGIRDRGVTSMKKLLGTAPALEAVMDVLENKLCRQ